jgi:hypothetical protein
MSPSQDRDHRQMVPYPYSYPHKPCFRPRPATFADVRKWPLRRQNRTAADTSEPPVLTWGSSGRRFKSCQPDTGQSRFWLRFVRFRWSDPND